MRTRSASLANVFRSLGDAPSTEKLVLEDTGRCWSGLYFPGLTLEELAEVARAHTKQVFLLRSLGPEELLRVSIERTEFNATLSVEELIALKVGSATARRPLDTAHTQQWLAHQSD